PAGSESRSDLVGGGDELHRGLGLQSDPSGSNSCAHALAPPVPSGRLVSQHSGCATLIARRRPFRKLGITLVGRNLPGLEQVTTTFPACCVVWTGCPIPDREGTQFEEHDSRRVEGAAPRRRSRAKRGSSMRHLS